MWRAKRRRSKPGDRSEGYLSLKLSCNTNPILLLALAQPCICPFLSRRWTPLLLTVTCLSAMACLDFAALLLVSAPQAHCSRLGWKFFERSSPAFLPLTRREFRPHWMYLSRCPSTRTSKSYIPFRRFAVSLFSHFSISPFRISIFGSCNLHQ